MNLTNEIFTCPDKARAHLEQTRWPHGPVCPHCGVVNEAKAIKGKSARAGLYQCNACRDQFTVTVGTVFERSKVSLNKWLLATYLVSSSKKGISSHQLGRTLGVTYKTAWFMMHRIREAMRTPTGVMGTGGGHVEMDETFIGREPGMKVKSGYHHKMKVLTLIDRNTGQSKSVVIDDLKPATIWPIVAANVSREAILMTDEALRYQAIGRQFSDHRTVNHGKEEYVSREDKTTHTNTIEGFFSVFKRGMKGIYQHCGKQHLHRYLAEFDFRYSNRAALGVSDTMRTDEALRGIGGKRLTYRRVGEAAYA